MLQFVVIDVQASLQARTILKHDFALQNHDWLKEPVTYENEVPKMSFLEKFKNSFFQRLTFVFYCWWSTFLKFPKISFRIMSYKLNTKNNENSSYTNLLFIVTLASPSNINTDHFC